MAGGGPKYEPLEGAAPSPDSLLLEHRLERIEQVVAARTRSVVVILDRLQDSFNMAAILRTCEGFGLQEVHVIDHPGIPFKPNGSVTQGCDKWLDLRKHRSFGACREALKSEGYQLLASAIAPGGQSLYALSFREKTALVFGNERYGVSDEVLRGVDGTFWIPMRGFTQSFNVSVAVATAVSRAVSWREEHLGIAGDLSPADTARVREQFQVLSVKQRRKIYKPTS